MDMKTKIFESAQKLIQQRGVNGFSYADIAKEVGVAKPSLHHHFATKTELVMRLMERYTDQLIEFLEQTAQTAANQEQALDGYFTLYQHTFDDGRACMGGMVAAEILTLDPQISPLLSRFFRYQQEWLTELINKGIATGEFKAVNSADKQATMIIATLQGALLISRAAENNEFLDQSTQALKSSMK